MITRLSVENRNINSNVCISFKEKNKENSNPNFKGIVGTTLLRAIQECEKNPMINVAAIDMISAILPRTFVESMTNWFAVFEAFRRESSGLIVNCLIPGGIAWLAALGLNKFVMPKNTNLASCWADHSLIDKATEIYKNSNAKDKIKDSLTEILGNTEGVNGKDRVLFKDILKDDLGASFSAKK